MNPLSTYPRPDQDNGWGFHSSSGAYEEPWMSEAWRLKFVGKRDITSLTGDDKRKVMRDYAQMLHDEYGIRWFKLLSGSLEQVDFLEALVDAGIETIVRPWKAEPHPWYVLPVDECKRYLDHGAHYIEWGNEPNLFGEWRRDKWDRGALVSQLTDQLLRNFDAVRRAGAEAGVQAVPLVPSMSPGGHYDSRKMFRRLLEELQQRNHLGVLEDAAVAIHNRPHNIPIDVPPSETMTVTFREYEWYDDQIREFVGHSLPLLGTEAGYEVGDHTVGEYPRITGELHAEYNLDIFRGFKDTWRPSLFCVCMWLIEIYEKSSFSFANAAWWYNKIAGGLYPNSILPAVHALRDEPVFTRTMPWEEAEDEPTPPTPLTLDVTQPEDGLAVEQDTIAADGRTSRPGATVIVRRDEDTSPITETVSDDTGWWHVEHLALVEGEQTVRFRAQDGDEVSPVVSRQVTCTPAAAPPEKDLHTVLVEEGEAHQVIQFNPDAALQKRIFADGFVPNSPEFTVEHDETAYVAQRAEHLDTGDVRIYYVPVGDWSNVEYVTR